MATQVQFRRGTASQNNNFTGANGELSVNLSNYSIRLHDGVTVGGYEMARANMSNAVFSATVLPSVNTTYNLGSASFKFANIFSETFTGALAGNADTATKLFTARNINGVAFDGTQDITIEAAIDKTLTIGTGLSGGFFDGETDVTIALKNSTNFTDATLLKWNSADGQFVNSLLSDNGTTASVGGNLTVTGDLLVQGSTTTISTTNLVVSDKLIVIGNGTETTQGADGAGFNIGSTGVSLTYDLANTSWTSSESFNLATGKTYKIAGTTVIGSSALGTGIITSSLTSVGTITTGVWNGTVISPTYGGTGVNNGTNTLTLSGNVTYTGGHTLELVTTAITNLTLPVTGTLSTLSNVETLTNKTLDAPVLLNPTLGNASATTVLINDIAAYTSASNTTTATTQYAILPLATALYSSVEYLIQAKSGNDTHVSKILLIHNGTDVTITEQNTLSSSAYLASYTADINEGNIRLLVTPASATSTTVKVVATAIKS
jgi:hypothetical protein